MSKVTQLRLYDDQLAFFMAPRTWKEILATRWYTKSQWIKLIILAEDEGRLVWLRSPRKAWVMTEKRHDTDKVPLSEIRQKLAEHEPMVNCPLGADPDCPLCHGVGTVPVTKFSLPESA